MLEEHEKYDANSVTQEGLVTDDTKVTQRKVDQLKENIESQLKEEEEYFDRITEQIEKIQQHYEK